MLLHPNHRIIPLFCLSLATFGCDDDEHSIVLDELEVSENEPSSDFGLDDGQGPPQGTPHGNLVAPTDGHCIVEATPVPDGVDPTTVRVADKPVTCFPRFSDAIFAVTGERLADDVTPETYEPLEFTSTSPAPQGASYVHGVEYEYANYGGKSLVVYGTGTCLESPWVLNKFSDPWWDNRISSARAYSGCNHSYHYEYVNLGGAVKDCGTSCSYIGDAMDNRTSSIRWTK